MKKALICGLLFGYASLTFSSNLTTTKVISVAVDKRFGDKVYVELQNSLINNPCQRDNIVALDTQVITDKEMLKDLRIAMALGTTIFIKGDGNCSNTFNGQSVENVELMKSTSQ